MRFNIKQGDTRTALKATLKNEKGESVDLTNCTVTFKMGCIINRNIEIIDRTEGRVWVVFDVSDVVKSGLYRAEFKVKYQDGKIETFPNQGYITVYIQGGVC